MTRKKLLIIILVLTLLSTGTILLLKSNTKYNKLVITEDKWNSIINTRNINTSISFENLEFNDYNLLIDNENSIIYYSIVDSSKKYNPSIKYLTNKKVHIAINSNITDDKLEDSSALKIMLYTAKEYRIYSLVLTKYPILNINYSNDNMKDVMIEIFDNDPSSPQRVIKSQGRFKRLDSKTYSFELFKESLGNNKRKNHISIFGMEKRDEYLIKKVEQINNNDKYALVFINNKNIGLYSLGPKERSVDIFARNKENNR